MSARAAKPPAARRAPSPRSDGAPDSPVILLLANDPFLLREAERGIAEALVPPEARSMSLDVVYGWEADPGRIEDFLQTFSFFGGKKLLVLRDVEEFGEWKKLLPYLDNPNPASCLLMTSSASPKAKENKARFTALSARAAVVERKRPTGRQLTGWVRERFAREGKEAGDEVIRSLVEAAGGDLGTLASEVAKVACFAGERKGIVVADLEVSLAGGGEGSVFAFLDAVGEKDLPQALRLGRGILLGGPRPDYLLFMLARHLRQLLRGKDLVRKGRGGAEAARELGMAWPFLQEKFARQLARWQEGELAGALEKLSAGDLAVKRSRVPADVLVDTLLFGLLGR